MSEFWTSQRLSITVRCGDSERTVELDKPVALLGSNAKCDVVLEGVDARALLLLATERGLRCVVLSPRSKRAGKVFAVHADTPVKLGKNSIFANSTLTGEQPLEGSDTGDSDVEEESLFTVTWKSSTTRHHLQLSQESPVLVGRKSPAAILLDDDHLSGVHCCLMRSDDRLYVVDLASGNGTFVGSEVVSSSQVKVDGAIRVGRSRLHFLRLHTDTAKQRLQADAQRYAESIEEEHRRCAELNQQQSLLTTGLIAQHLVREQLDQELHELRGKATELESELSDAKEKADRLTEDLSRSQVEHRELLTRWEQQERELAQVNANATELSEQIEDALAEQEEQRLAKSQLRNQLDEAKSHNQNLAEELEQLNAEQQRHQAETEQLHQRIAALEAETSELEAARTAMVAERVELEQKLDQQKEDLGDESPLHAAEEKLATQQRELDAVRKELEVERRVLATLQDEIDVPTPTQSEAVVDDGVLASFDFQDALAEALEALPPADEELTK